MTERTNEYSVVKRDLSSPYHKDYWEAKKARKQAPLSPKRVTLAKAYFDTEPEEEVNENQGRRVKKEKVKRQRTKGRMKRARRGFMVFLVALFSLLYVLVGALSFLQLDALKEYNSYFSMFTKVEEVYAECTKRVSTGLLNKVINEAYALNPPQTIRNKRLKILYSTQAAVHPPTFLLFANNEELIKEHYKRYLENKIREAFGFFGTPIRISVRTRSEKAKKK